MPFEPYTLEDPVTGRDFFVQLAIYGGGFLLCLIAVLALAYCP